MSRGLRSAVNELLAAAQAHGCIVKQARKGHWQVRRSGYPAMVTVSCSPSDQKAIQNIRGDLRRYLGVKV